MTNVEYLNMMQEEGLAEDVTISCESIMECAHTEEIDRAKTEEEKKEICRSCISAWLKQEAELEP